MKSSQHKMAGYDGLYHIACVLVFVFLSINSISCSSSHDDDKKSYIVYMGALPRKTMRAYSPTSQHLGLLRDVLGDESSASTSIVRSYKRSFNGFAAKLTEREAKEIARKDGVFSVFPSKTYHVQTTKSWDYIGFPRTVKRNFATESGTIIGVIDSGVYPDSESFSDEGFGPPPKKWKGSCKGGPDFSCNKKLIGARYYGQDDTAFDAIGHGTHTASTAAGSLVEGASFFGIVNGTARGAVPSSSIAVYKVCGEDGCASEDILAGFDDAIADGVDIITVSLGGNSPSPIDQDPVAIGSFHATSKGILVTHSAGNSGPDRGTVSSVAPWVLTVAANSIDRKFISKLVLGDGTTLTGNTVNSFPSTKNTALVFGDQAGISSCDEASARSCLEGCLDMRKVSGKILICDGNQDGPAEAATYNASGVILKTRRPDTGFIFPLPAVALEDSSFEKLVAYHSSTRKPVGRILKGDVAPNPNSPAVASFSSRGPSMITPDIMKPDVSAPGVDILAAYPKTVPLSSVSVDDRRVSFSVLSGTSMSCPHAAGAAAYIKTFHPKWSPSAIKSALMTTASRLSDNGTKDFPSSFEFDYGSGQINPVKAVDPGLVYEITTAEYVNLLCGLGYNIGGIDSNSSCPMRAVNFTEPELNYPSFIFKAPVSKSFKLSLKRTVTNVGPASSTYKARVISSSAIKITVVPEVLSFKSISEKKSYTVNISGSGLKSDTQMSEEIIWSDGVRSVRSPIIVYS